MDPAGKVAVITGGGSGIGRTTALRLAEQGASIMIIDLNDRMGEETVSLIERKGGRAAADAGVARDQRQRAPPGAADRVREADGDSAEQSALEINVAQPPPA